MFVIDVRYISHLGKVLALKPREDLLALCVLVRLPLVVLLPRLLPGGELAHRGHGETACFELILGIALALQHRRINRLEDKIVLGSGKVEQAQTVNVALVLGW